MVSVNVSWDVLTGIAAGGIHKTLREIDWDQFSELFSYFLEPEDVDVAVRLMKNARISVDFGGERETLDEFAAEVGWDALVSPKPRLGVVRSSGPDGDDAA